MVQLLSLLGDLIFKKNFLINLISIIPLSSLNLTVSIQQTFSEHITICQDLDTGLITCMT